MATPTIGIPRSMFFHSEAGLVTTFLESIGVRPVLSPPTDRSIMERGIALAVDETCLPMKIHLGHVDSLRGSVDRVLVPRYAVLPGDRGETCVKFWGAYDVTRNVFPELPILSYDVDRIFGRSERRALSALGRELGASPLAARRAWREADASRREARTRAIAQQARLVEETADLPSVLVCGHSYVLDDRFMGAPLLSLLEDQGVTVVRSDRAMEPHEARSAALEFSPGLKWVYNSEQVGAIAKMRGRVGGILLLLTFPCGPDSLCAELVQRAVRDVPVCVIVLDELTAAGGMQTRIESFCDIIKMRRSA